MKPLFTVERQLVESVKMLRNYCAKVIKERREDADLENREDLLSRFLAERDQNGKPLVRQAGVQGVGCASYSGAWLGQHNMRRVYEARASLSANDCAPFIRPLSPFRPASQSDERLSDIILSFVSTSIQLCPRSAQRPRGQRG